MTTEASIEPAHHNPDGGFRNPWPATRPHGFKDFLTWRLLERPRDARQPDPPRDSLPRRMPAIVRPRAARGYRSATWVGHSSVLLQLGPLNVLTDPMWSERASPVQWIGPRRIMSPAVDFDALPDIDVVLQSHNHYDHLDSATVRRLAARYPSARWLCPLGVGELLRSFGVRDPVERDWWQALETPSFAATCTPAQHFSGRTLRDRNKTLWAGWTLAADGVNVYFAGDTALHPEFPSIASRLGPFDLVMLPIGAYDPEWFMGAVHMNPEEAVSAYRHLVSNEQRTACLPIHWGTIRLTDEPTEAPRIRFERAWSDAGLPSSANWLLAHGETRQFATGA